MIKEDLHQSLQALQDELDKLEESHEEVRDRATRLIYDIEQQLDDPEGQGDSPIDRIPKLIEEFEVEHPRITGIMNRIMMALSDMGI
ncbi:MAG: DUF4404 family protein [Thiotrichales bacterium]|nr:DUF4404 family protein [Thiotrichales bacterium]